MVSLVHVSTLLLLAAVALQTAALPTPKPCGEMKVTNDKKLQEAQQCTSMTRLQVSWSSKKTTELKFPNLVHVNGSIVVKAAGGQDTSLSVVLPILETVGAHLIAGTKSAKSSFKVGTATHTMPHASCFTATRLH